MAGSSQTTGKEKEKAFTWTDVLTCTFLKVIKEFQEKNGYGTLSWPLICAEFENRTGKSVSVKIGKNKFRHLKAKWSSWTYLRYKVTGAGWDHETGLITADAAWWDRQRAEDFYQFRKKPPSTEMSDLWDDVFRQIVATGKHVIAPSMDVDSFPASVAEDHIDDGGVAEVDSEESLERQMEKDAMQDNTQQSQKMTVPQSKGKSTTTSSQALNVNKRRRKLGPAAAAYQENLALVGETSKQMLSLMKGDIGSSNTANQMTEFKDAFKELMRLVTDGLMERKSNVWCYAVTELSKDDKRQIFMIIEDDADKVAWLNHEYDMMRLRLSK